VESGRSSAASERQQLALLALSRQPIKRQNLHPSTTFDCGLPDGQKAPRLCSGGYKSVAVCTALCLQIDRYADMKLCSETMFGLSPRVVVKAIKAERPESTRSGSSGAERTMAQGGRIADLPPPIFLAKDDPTLRATIAHDTKAST
jgi:hypothetical protein